MVLRTTIGGISSEAVEKATGKSWRQWLTVLDQAGGRKMTHKQIVAVVGNGHGVGPWWQQMVTVGYEQARGLRAKHQKPGGFSISKSKTLVASAADVFRAWILEDRRRRWLGGAKLTIRKATPARSLRITWGADQTRVDVNLYPKAGGKSQIAVQHEKLGTAAQAAKMKTYWAQKLERLRKLVEE